LAVVFDLDFVAMINAPVVGSLEKRID